MLSDNCDPSGNKSCLFASVIANGSAMSFQLSGVSMGYIALGLTVNASQGTTMLFICAQNSSNSGSFFSDQVTTEISGIVNGNVIKCSFTVPNMNSTTFSILLGTGNITDNGPGPFKVSFNSGLLNLTNPASNVPTTVPPVVNTTVTNPASNVTTTVPPVVKPTVASSTVAHTTVANTTMANTTVARTTMANSIGAVQPHGTS
ncbi:uncharacterized protein LOC114565248 [Perca flavescens]|uniref:uncharacterized protein LOC114565248 n=1 Tax=Perca flavescens TaxID=8167 RepID=UPI00106EC331|nr:uncharacterized protein LOC114565248 [Perca flavescens]